MQNFLFLQNLETHVKTHVDEFQHFGHKTNIFMNVID